MPTKLYYFGRMQIAFWLVMSFIPVGCLIGLFFDPRNYWFFIFPLVIYILFFGVLVRTDFFAPLIIKEHIFKVKGKEYSWQNVKIIAYPETYKSFHYPYTLYFYTEEQFFDIKNRKKASIWKCYLNNSNLKAILQHYEKPIQILDVDGVKTNVIGASAQIKNKIQSHNARYKAN